MAGPHHVRSNRSAAFTPTASLAYLKCTVGFARPKELNPARLHVPMGKRDAHSQAKHWPKASWNKPNGLGTKVAHEVRILSRWALKASLVMHTDGFL